MLYIKRSDGVYVVYEGMTLSQIIDCLAEMGFTGEVVDEAEYKTAIATASRS